MAGVSSWKKGHFASLAPHTRVAEHPWIKAECQEIFLEFFGFLYPLYFLDRCLRDEFLCPDQAGFIRVF